LSGLTLEPLASSDGIESEEKEAGCMAQLILAERHYQLCHW
jgi:hypothetical protein